MFVAKLFGIFDEISQSAKASADVRSFFRVVSDLIACRRPLVGLLPKRWLNRERSIALKQGVTLTYRFNKGDIWSLKEVWLTECYSFPRAIAPRVIVDLGANIGLTSVWLARRYAPELIISVEPSSSNVALIRRNLEQNALNGVVIEAAIGPTDGTGDFLASSESNRGHVDFSAEGFTQVQSMNTIIENHLKADRVGLLKLDIEGGEEHLMSENLQWLSRVDAIVAEFHPEKIDYTTLLTKFTAMGFHHIPPNTIGRDNMDSFVRE